MLEMYFDNKSLHYLMLKQKYTLLQEWSIHPTTGYPVRGGFGHSSVWDHITNRIYVYGGYVSTASTAAVITNSIYSLDPITRHWKRQTSSSSYRYLHSAVASSGKKSLGFQRSCTMFMYYLGRREEVKTVKFDFIP